MPSKYRQPSTERQTPKGPTANALDALAPAMDNTAEHNLGHAVGAVFSALNGIARLHDHKAVETLRRGEWVQPEWNQTDFEKYCHEAMRPEAADHLISHVAKIRAAGYHESDAEIAEKEARAVRKAELESSLRFSRLRIDSLMPGDLYDANFETTQDAAPLVIADGNRRAHRLCARLVGEWELMHKGLTLAGPDSGCGKTYLAAAAAVELMRLKSLQVRWVSAAGLLELYRRSFGATWDKHPGVMSSEQVWQNFAVRPGLLVLDDLGAEKVASGEAGDWARERFLQLIDHRYEGKKTILVTTNLTEQQMRDKYGARIVSRLLGRSPLIEVTGPDFRQTVMPNSDDPFAD